MHQLDNSSTTKFPMDMTSGISSLAKSGIRRADKYPGISPYAYCALNPIKYVDPDGRDAVLITFPNPHK